MTASAPTGPDEAAARAPARPAALAVRFVNLPATVSGAALKAVVEVTAPAGEASSVQLTYTLPNGKQVTTTAQKGSGTYRAVFTVPLEAAATGALRLQACADFATGRKCTSLAACEVLAE